MLIILESASVVLYSEALVGHRRRPQNMIHRLQESAPTQSIPENDDDTTTSNSLPAVHGLDKENGILPPGAYRRVEDDIVAPCLISVGIRPPENYDREEVWREGVKNCQKLIDSGFNSFRVNNNCCRGIEENNGSSRRRRSPSSIALESILLQQRTLETEIRHEAETNFYCTLRQRTPASLLRSCHFMTNLEVPSILHSEDSLDKDISPVPFGNGWMVRESISNALLRTKGEYLDSVILECEFNLLICWRCSILIPFSN